MEKFINLFQEHNKEYSEKVILDEIPGYLRISVNKMIFEWIDINFPNCRRKIHMSFNNKDQLKEKLIELFNIRFWKDEPFLNEKEYMLRKSFAEMVNEIQGKKSDECYVCFGDTKKYVTPCGHPICYGCFVKSLRYKEHDDEEFLEFVCGMCRKQKLNYCP